MRQCGVPGCWRAAQYADPPRCRHHYDAIRKVVTHPRTCTVEGCQRRRHGPRHCHMHSARLKRYGSVDIPPQPPRSRINAAGYVEVRAVGHPMARPSQGWALEHRLVLFDAIGAGPHPCHHCGQTLTWRNHATHADGLTADHLDGNKVNNARANLVPSCNGCNTARGRNKRWGKGGA